MTLEIDEPAVDLAEPAPDAAPEVVAGRGLPDLDEDLGADAVPPAEPAATPETDDLDVVEVALQPVRLDASPAAPDEAIDMPEVGDVLTD